MFYVYPSSNVVFRVLFWKATVRRHGLERLLCYELSDPRRVLRYQKTELGGTLRGCLLCAPTQRSEQPYLHRSVPFCLSVCICKVLVTTIF